MASINKKASSIKEECKSLTREECFVIARHCFKQSRFLDGKRGMAGKNGLKRQY